MKIINKRKAEPLYQKIKDILRQDIINNKYEFLSESQIVYNFKVSIATAKRVLNELAEEGIVVRKVGKGTIVVSGQQHINLGVIFFDFISSRDPFITEISQGIEEKAVSKSYHLSFYTTRQRMISEEPLSPLYQAIVKRRLHGIFVLSPISLQDIIFLQNNKIPIVSVRTEYKGINLNTVIFNEYEVITQVMKKLLNDGYKKIALMVRKTETDKHAITGTDRIRESYNAFVKENNLSYSRIIVTKSHTEEDGYLTISEINSWSTAKKPEVLIVYSEKLSKGVLRYIKETNRCDIYLILLSGGEKFPTPFIFQDLHLLGKTAFDLLDRSIYESTTNGEKVIVPLKVMWKDK